jgi:glyoxylase-like metal-dependent hydrolase (beta-lactamase superfamily II)
MSTRLANEVSRRQFLISSGVAVAAACLAPPRLFSQQGLVEMALKESATAKITVQTLRRNISVLLGPGGNIAVLTGPDGKLLVNAEVVSARPNVTAALASINADPIKQLINTHRHFDHTGGNDWVLVEPLKIAFDMRPQQLLHAVVGELRFEFGNRALWIA